MKNAVQRVVRLVLTLAAFFFIHLQPAQATITGTANCTTVGSACWQYRAGSGFSWQPTAAQACAALMAVTSSATSYEILNGSAQERNCRVLNSSGSLIAYRFPLENGAVTPATVCPANSTVTTGTSCQCNAGYEESGNACVVNQCAANAGQTKIINNTVAWFRSTDYDDWRAVGQTYSPPAVACEAGCKWSRGQDVKAWRSLEPSAQGLYRGSLDTQYVSTAESCTAGTADLNNPTAPNATCPGYVGEVNGKAVCVGTADKPIPSPTGPGLPSSASPGNPAAGKAPDSGAGSGVGGNSRTPTTGAGGNAGGPSSAGVPTSSTQVGGSTVNTPGEGKEQAACGAPGQPKCGIDESGTPGALSEGQYHAKVDAVRSEADAARDQIAGSSDKSFFTGWGVFFGAPPIVACVPMAFPNDMGAINPCGVVEGVRTVMAFLWALSGLFLCLYMIKKVV